MLSLCLIVKNEEDTLYRCLNKAKKIASEIIVVDTGSNDKTKEIALSFTDKVFDFQWCDDFSKARNFSISKATNDWILILDADEVINDYNLKTIKAFCCEKNNKIVGRLKRINEFEDEQGSKKYIERVNRIFNKNNFFYEGIIHEQILSQNGDKYLTKDIDLVINHIGYMKEVVNKTNKIQRNIELLIKTLESNNKDPYLLYQLGKSYYMAKDFNKAERSFNAAISLVNDFNYEYVQDLVESYGYTLINLGLYKEALVLKNYIKYYNKSPDFFFLIGLIEMNNANFKESVENFLKCTMFNEGKIEGITTSLPYHNIAVIYECLGFKDEALKYFKLSRS